MKIRAHASAATKRRGESIANLSGRAKGCATQQFYPRGWRDGKLVARRMRGNGRLDRDNGLGGCPPSGADEAAFDRGLLPQPAHREDDGVLHPRLPALVEKDASG